jgi:hypothetical protein
MLKPKKLKNSITKTYKDSFDNSTNANELPAL